MFVPQSPWLIKDAWGARMSFVSAEEHVRSTAHDDPRTSWGAHDLLGWLKAAFDRTFALIALIAISPILACVAALIWIRNDGPIFYAHNRIGKNGAVFPCYKFRSMTPDDGRLFDQLMEIDPIARKEWIDNRKVYRDPRVTRLGAFLRSSSIDELPQFWNVLRGDMSVVGPRPVTEEELEKYGVHAADYLSIRPGLTGPWQVSGRSEISFKERVEIDADYIENWSFWGDLKIILRTVRTVALRQGAM